MIFGAGGSKAVGGSRTEGSSRVQGMWCDIAADAVIQWLSRGIDGCLSVLLIGKWGNGCLGPSKGEMARLYKCSGYQNAVFSSDLIAG